MWRRVLRFKYADISEGPAVSVIWIFPRMMEAVKLSSNIYIDYAARRILWNVDKFTQNNRRHVQEKNKTRNTFRPLH